MTNREKFLEVMNQTFGAGLSTDNMRNIKCSPCGIYKYGSCNQYTCAGCEKWWEKEYKKEVSGKP